MSPLLVFLPRCKCIICSIGRGLCDGTFVSTGISLLGLKMGAKGTLHFSTKCPRVSPLLVVRPGCKCMICSRVRGLSAGAFALSLLIFLHRQNDPSKHIFNFGTKGSCVSPLLTCRHGCKWIICSACCLLCNGTLDLPLATFLGSQNGG